ncbi:hypothetical protein KUH03_26775 [Sphingobacterium sp. E70]|uniref:hypothetical protein n=1 Tax=Sphingobacterium sp. E70 TaxID=2853439 RepID=UPI00211CE8AA|nr:hypothetical protein [Sphingobacterium sp. E70]ULT22876.1 hypothetical protein KUH03_26775 [Sphingobacterium sp. E70]
MKSTANYTNAIFAIGRELNQQKEYAFAQKILEPVYLNLSQQKSEGQKGNTGRQYQGESAYNMRRPCWVINKWTKRWRY